MIIHVEAAAGATAGILSQNGQTFACALGRTGIIPAKDKREGDGATPAGAWPLRRVLYRADRMAKPVTSLPAEAIKASDGWCDAPEDPCYNRGVQLPYKASAETLWRQDALYDLIIVLGHNDDPVRASMGSAIFFHVAKPIENGLAATEGCVALPKDVLMKVLESCSTETVMDISIIES